MPAVSTPREVPAPLLVAPAVDTTDTSYPDSRDEPVLRADQIQGNILAGFNKDHQTVLFLDITDVAACKAWLQTVIPYVATLEEVLAYNRLFKRIRARRGECSTIQATWINIAFSYKGLQQLVPNDVAFLDNAFKAGLAARSGSLGDPTDATMDGHPSNWVVGGTDNEADIVLIFAADDPADLTAEVARIEDSLYAARTPTGSRTRSGVRLMYKQHGNTLPQPRRGHEHFGFLDGISQPGIRGRLTDNPHDVLTPRQNPTNRNQGKPGQDLLWPGEFVFGYPKQDSGGPVPKPGDIAEAGPAWAENGSFLVIRRLRQDVPTFTDFCEQTAMAVGMDPALFGAKLVGRWTSGAPVLRAALADNPTLGDNDCANNNYDFQASTEALPDSSEGSLDCTDFASGSASLDHFPPSPGDQTGQICPFAAHTRKAYPRDDTPSPASNPYAAAPSRVLNEADTQTHRLLRRGIPFGQPAPISRSMMDSGDRGLLFLAYQTSIERQFEFVTNAWINSPDFKDTGAGIDPILGQNNQDPSRVRTFTVIDATGMSQSISAPADFVIPTGGGYFFAPSLQALQETIAR